MKRLDALEILRGENTLLLNGTSEFLFLFLTLGASLFFFLFFSLLHESLVTSLEFRERELSVLTNLWWRSVGIDFNVLPLALPSLNLILFVFFIVFFFFFFFFFFVLFFVLFVVILRVRLLLLFAFAFQQVALE